MRTNTQSTSLLESTTPTSQRVKRTLWQILGINVLVAAAKIIVEATTGSISMVADGFHDVVVHVEPVEFSG